jgi:tetratricopeptide (TPR) repeat protein
VLRPNGTAPGSESDSGDGNVRIPLPKEDLDPARSPDDSFSDTEGGQQQGYSSSVTGMDSVLPSGADTPTGKGKRKQKDQGVEPVHQETAAEDISVGKYYLDNRDWRAALSRFQSALVLSPEEPEVYWGLAESARHLGNFADARAYYEKLAEYDPDSRHGKDAIKALREPEIANAKAASTGQTAAPQK